MLPDAPVGQRLDDPGDMRALAPQPVAFPDNGHIAFSVAAQTVLQPRPVVRRTGGVVPADLPRGDAGAAHYVALQIRGKSTGNGIACFGRTPHACLSLGPGAQVGKRLAQEFTRFRKQPIHCADPTRDHGALEPVLRRGRRSVNFSPIAGQWNRIGEFCAAFPAGHASASAALQRLNWFRASSRFYAANKKPGRALKTEVLLQYRSQPTLRAKCAVACSRSGSFSLSPAPCTKAGAAASALQTSMTR